MKTPLLTLYLILVWVLTACASQPALAALANPPLEETKASAVSTATPAEIIFKTAVGDLVYESARFVDEANGVTPAKGCKLLLVGFRRPDGSGIDLQQFVDARMQILVRGEDGSETLSTMGGGCGWQVCDWLPGAGSDPDLPVDLGR